MIRFVVWGAGRRGIGIAKNIYSYVEAFIDSDKNKVGMFLEDKRVISFEDYIEKYRDCYIIVSPIFCTDIINTIKQSGIKRYFDLSLCAPELIYWRGGKCWFDMPIEFKPQDKYCIFGIGLTGVLTYILLCERGCSDISMVVDKEHRYVEGELRETLSKVSINEKRDVDSHGILIQTSREELSEEVVKRKRVVDFSKGIYDLICPPHNLNLLEFKNLHKGQRAFIVGNGPSLKNSDLERLKEKGIVCFATNGIFFSAELTLWRPDYYVIDDTINYSVHRKEIIKYDAKVKFLGCPWWCLNEDYWNDFLQKKEIYRFNTVYINRFGENFEECLFGTSTVTFTCIEIAVYMGFKEIYLIGVDHDYSNGAHFSSQYDDKIGSLAPDDPQREARQFSYQGAEIDYICAKEYAEDHGVKIFNATRGGHLEVFERKDLDMLLNEL